MVAIAFVIIFHALIGYAFITGLAYNVVKKAVEDLKTFDVQEEPPPPPEQPPPPPPQTKVEPPPMVAPPPIVQQPISVAPVIQTVPQAPAPVMHIDAPPAPKPSIAVGAKPKGRFQDLMSAEDYPPSSLRNNEEGTVGFTLAVGTDGKVSGCTITQSSGHPLLDDTACKLLQRRARFTPAQNAEGAAMPGSYNGRFTWKVPKD
jgi:protein TonB